MEFDPTQYRVQSLSLFTMPLATDKQRETKKH